ncbi:uncharacterized protein [Euphorbia lathyris]|uniref:uncharacterized protein n=1 Tax=Euphorbia lathyris TaxID=212925 RepID=UPI0033144501
MASRGGGVVQESSVEWNTNVSKAPRRGRTPLGDLSNSLKPSLSQASKKQSSSSLFSLSETGVSQNVIKKKGKGINAQASKKLQPSGRKALSDISNSGRSNLNEGSKKNSCASKLSVLAEEPIDASEIAGEQFLHNHKECIKAQSRPMDLNLFLKTIGLDNNDFPMEQTSPMPYQSPPRDFKLEEMDEEFIEHRPWKHKFYNELDSPPPVKSPKYYMDYDLEFQLKGSP